MKTRGIPLGCGVCGVKAYVPGKGIVIWYDLTKEEIKILTNGKQ